MVVTSATAITINNDKNNELAKPLIVSRFISSQEQVSLADDAPGWAEVEEEGPICWKCKGVGTKKIRNPDKKKEPLTVLCRVCHGLGKLSSRKKSIKPGVITRGRKRPHNDNNNDGWEPKGPQPHGVSINDYYSKLVKKANTSYVDIDTSKVRTLQGQESQKAPSESQMNPPEWLPRVGEQLCNLVGSWRILQKVGSHRWTTDDLVTAYVAISESQDIVNYLDLGTGNASVLQMTTWGLLQQKNSDNDNNDKSLRRAIGIEARSEAIALARRSLQFNIGSKKKDDRNKKFSVEIIEGDFRDFFLLDEKKSFDLITGTPPYFEVKFHSSPSTNVVQKAVIHEGGMPTCKQSAPARCEFRGGIEAYCEAAAQYLSPSKNGKFVVCINWINHQRTLSAAKTYNLHILKQVRVHGAEGKGILFCVYVMTNGNETANAHKENEEPIIETLVVRSSNGQWTQQYKEKVLETMSIPYF